MTISCSQQKATKAEFSFTIGAISTSSFPGGLMIYGQNTTGTQVFGQRHFSGPMALDLQNGDWQFFAVGWSGTTPMTGTTRCALASAKLAGEPVSVNLNLTATNCALPAFVPSSAFLATGNPQAVSLHACNDLTGLSAASDCTGRVSEHRSFRVVFPSYRGSAEDVEHLEASDLRGSCVPANAAGLAATSNTIPAGSDRFYLATEIQAFTSTDCSGDAYGYLFKNGLTRGDEDTETLVFDAGNITKVFLFYDEVSSPPPAPPGPLAPMGLALLSPPTSASFSGSIAVSGNLDPSAVITLHADMTCMSTPIGTQAFTGDPTTVAFTAVTEGMYSVYAKQTVAGVDSPCSSASVLFNIDATPPSPPTSLSWTSGTVTNAASIQLAWMPAMDLGSGILDQEVGLYTDPSCAAPYGGSFILAPGATTYSFTSIPDGIYYAKINVKDNALNTAPSSCSPPVTVDRMAPLAATALTIPMGPTNASTLTLTWTRSTSPDLFGQELVVSNDSMCTSISNVIPLPAADSIYSLAVTDGFYSYKIRSLDLANNESFSACSSATFVDQSALPPGGIALVSPMTTPGNSANVSISVTGVEDGAQVTAFSDPSCTTPISAPFTASGGIATINLDTFTAEGVTNIYASQTDPVLNVSPCSTSFVTYEFDITPPPPPTILGVNGNQDAIIDSIFSSNTPLTFHWTPQAGIQAYTIRVTNSLSATECSIVEFPGGVSQYAFSSCSPTTDDTLTVWMQARDAAGNLSPTTTFKFVNSWLTPLGQLPTARYGFKAVKNNLNQIILWGGYDGGLTSQGLISNDLLSTWVPISTVNAPAARRGHAMVWNGTQMLVAGGENGSTSFGDLYTFTGSSWSNLATIPTGATSDMAYGYSSLAGKFVIWGGLQLPTNYKNVGSIWNGSSWTTLPTPPTPLNPRSLMAFGVEGDYFVVWGGTDGATQYNDGMYYKFSMNQSYDMAPSPLSPRFNASSTMVNGKLLVWGGQDVVGNRFSDGALFDPATNTWTTLSPSFPPPPLSEAMVTTDGQRIYFRGGRFDNVNNSSQTFMYDLATNQWDALPFTNLPAGLTNGVFMNFGSQLLMIGGSDTFDFPTTNVRLLKPAP